MIGVKELVNKCHFSYNSLSNVNFQRFNSSRISNVKPNRKFQIQNAICNNIQEEIQLEDEIRKLQTIRNHLLNITKVRHKRPIFIFSRLG